MVSSMLTALTSFSDLKRKTNYNFILSTVVIKCGVLQLKGKWSDKTERQVRQSSFLEPGDVLLLLFCPKNVALSYDSSLNDM